VFTASEDVDKPQFISFPVPGEESKLSPGSPSWANYIKGVIAHYKG